MDCKHRGAIAGATLLAVASLALGALPAHADGARVIIPQVAPAHAPVSTPAVTSAATPVMDQLAALNLKLQEEDDKILNTQGAIADAQDRNANLMGVTIGVGLVLMLLFAGILFAMRRTAKASTAAARALSILERAYVFPGKDIAVTAPSAPGPSASVRMVFHASFTNHGRTPAVIRWINLDHQYLSQAPDGVYEDHERHGIGTVIGSGETQPLRDSELIIPRSEWERAEAGDGAIYLHGRVVYRDIFAAQHETYFCRRYDIASRAFVIVESESLNRYD